MCVSNQEKQIIDSSAELRDLLTVPTAKHSITTRSFQSRGGSKVQQICRHGTRQECLSAAIQAYDELKPTNSHLTTPRVCGKIHFRRIMFPHTGTISFVNALQTSSVNIGKSLNCTVYG